MINLKFYDVNVKSPRACGSDIFLCEDENQIPECVTARYPGGIIQSYREINEQQVRVKDLTAGDLIKLLK